MIWESCPLVPSSAALFLSPQNVTKEEPRYYIVIIVGNRVGPRLVLLCFDNKFLLLDNQTRSSGIATDRPPI